MKFSIFGSTACPHSKSSSLEEATLAALRANFFHLYHGKLLKWAKLVESLSGERSQTCFPNSCNQRGEFCLPSLCSCQVWIFNLCIKPEIQSNDFVLLSSVFFLRTLSFLLLWVIFFQPCLLIKISSSLECVPISFPSEPSSGYSLNWISLRIA